MKHTFYKLYFKNLNSNTSHRTPVSNMGATPLSDDGGLVDLLTVGPSIRAALEWQLREVDILTGGQAQELRSLRSGPVSSTPAVLDLSVHLLCGDADLSPLLSDVNSLWDQTVMGWAVSQEFAGDSVESVGHGSGTEQEAAEKIF